MASDLLVVGRIGRPFGVRGWMRLHSETDPPESIFDLGTWYLEARKLRGRPRRSEEAASFARLGEGWRAVRVAERRPHADGYVVRFVEIDERDGAEALRGCRLAVERSRLPEPEPGEYYWADLVGLDVVDGDGALLGRIESLIETGSNDVLVVSGARRRLIPFTLGDAVLEVDLPGRRVRVDWEVDL